MLPDKLEARIRTAEAELAAAHAETRMLHMQAMDARTAAGAAEERAVKAECEKTMIDSEAIALRQQLATVKSESAAALSTAHELEGIKIAKLETEVELARNDVSTVRAQASRR